MKVTLCFTCLHSSVAQGCFNVCFTTSQHLLYFLGFFVIYRLERNKNSSLFVLMLSTSKWVTPKSYYVMAMVSYKSPRVQFSELLLPLKISWSSIKLYSYQGLFSEDLCYWSTTIKHMMWDSSDQKQMPTYMHIWYQIHTHIYIYISHLLIYISLRIGRLRNPIRKGFSFQCRRWKWKSTFNVLSLH